MLGLHLFEKIMTEGTVATEPYNKQAPGGGQLLPQLQLNGQYLGDTIDGRKARW